MPKAVTEGLQYQPSPEALQRQYEVIRSRLVELSPDQIRELMDLVDEDRKSRFPIADDTKHFMFKPGLHIYERGRHGRTSEISIMEALEIGVDQQVVLWEAKVSGRIEMDLVTRDSDSSFSCPTIYKITTSVPEWMLVSS